MKSLNLLAATATLAALSAISAHAQGTMTPTDPMTGKPAMMVAPNANMMDRYMASWTYRNLDAPAVKHYKAEGLSDKQLMMAANIAMRANLDLDYVVRLYKESGMPFNFIASEFKVSTTYLNSDVVGYGADTMSMPMAPMGGMKPMTPMSGGSSMAAPMASGTIVDLAMGNPDLSTLVAAVKAAGLVSMLSGPGPFTVFAPTNEAFAKLPAGTVEDLMKPENKEKLRAILQYHVVPGKIMAADVMAMANPSMPKTENGSMLTVKTTAPVMVNDANVTQTDIVGSNGVVHVIDTVLMPPAA